MICPSCNTDNRDGAKFCDECGFRLADIEQVAEEVEEPVESSQELDLPAVVEEPGAEEAESETEPEAEEIGDQQDDPDETQDADFEEEVSEPEVSPLSGLDVSVPIIFDPVPLTSIDDAAITREIPVVGAGYKKPESAWKTGGTMEMPRVESNDAPANTDFRAPDPNDRKNRKRQAKELRKQQKAAERAARGESGSGRPVGAVVGVVILIAAVLIAGGTYMFELWGGKSTLR